jgi:lipoprotein-releasing system permease protein
MPAFAIASRFLRSSPTQTAMIIAGIGVGIAVQIFVGSLITSLQADLVDSAVGSSPHITLLSEDGQPVSGTLAGEAAAEPEVVTAIPVRRMSALFVDGDSVPLDVTGGAPADLDTIYRVSDRIVAGDYSLDGGEVLVGTGFAASAGIGPGDGLELVLPNGGVGEFTVTGVFDLGAAAANDRVAFLDSESVAEALDLGENEYSAIEIQVDEVFTSTEVASRLEADGLEVIDWQEENEELLSGLAAQSGSSLMIQAFVLVAVALGIASTLAISAVQKTRQIGILKAMGMTDAASGRIFLLQALILGTAGVAAGVALGFLLIWGFSSAPVDFSVRPSPTLIMVSASIGIAVALASSVIPYRSTSRLNPIEVIQSG